MPLFAGKLHVNLLQILNGLFFAGGATNVSGETTEHFFFTYNWVYLCILTYNSGVFVD